MYNSEGMADSGIEVDLMSYLSSENDPASEHSDYYQLKSKVIVGSPVTEIKHASMPMRANLKQQLQRQQLLEQEKREQQQLSQSLKHNTHATGSRGIAVPRVVDAAEVPSNVLEVKTQLQHPTRYHVRQSQKRQVQHFLNESHEGHHPIQSLPANVVSAVGTEQQQYHVQASSSAPDPDLPSPLLGSVGEFNPNNFDLLGDLQSVDPLELGSLLGESDLIEIQPSLGASNLPQTGLIQSYEAVDADNSIGSPSSCPTTAYRRQELTTTGIMSVQDELWRKERIKKDNHNMIERRRRFNINDRIKELGGLLPKTIDPDMRQNKGTILKASVDYIKTLQDEQRKYKVMMEQKKKTDADLRKLVVKLNQMSSLMKSHGIESPLMSDPEIAKLNNMMTSDLLNFTQSSSIHSFATPASSQATPSSTATSFSYTTVDELMDESSPVSGDPMLLSAPVSPEADDHALGFSFHN